MEWSVNDKPNCDREQLAETVDTDLWVKNGLHQVGVVAIIGTILKTLLFQVAQCHRQPAEGGIRIAFVSLQLDGCWR